jgi:peptidoglycan/LPS O-acetylase OafA/YrhL
MAARSWRRLTASGDAQASTAECTDGLALLRGHQHRLFHFSNPNWFGFGAGGQRRLRSVSFFILLSGFVLAYNYAAGRAPGELDRKCASGRRASRALSHLPAQPAAELAGNGAGEYGAHTHAMFWTGVVLTPLLLQGWIPAIATFLNTPAWTMSAEAATT